eukprot:m.128857 g.128857  ORF g.128857 m.128857 type:complete len:680 (-) comp9420_c0_seq2:138-2177(-)
MESSWTSSPVRIGGALALLACAAFAVRLFLVLRFSPFLNDVEPYFNLRVAEYIADHGYLAFLDWFDDRSWFPLGRHVASTSHAGAPVTAALATSVLRAIGFTVSVESVCIFLAPAFAAASIVAIYALASEVKGPRAGLFAAFFLALAPGYAARTIAGNFLGESVGVPTALAAMACWLRAARSGAIVTSIATGFFAAFTAFSWGGYTFLFNVLPLHVLALAAAGLADAAVHRAYTIAYITAAILVTQVPLVAARSPYAAEHLLSFAVFALAQARAIQARVAPGSTWLVAAAAPAVVLAVAMRATTAGGFAAWISTLTGGAIRSSLSEQQPTAWASFYLDLQLLMLLVPAGLYFCLRVPSKATIFAVVLGLASLYSASTAIRNMLQFTLAACVLAAVAMSRLLTTYFPSSDSARDQSRRKDKDRQPYQHEIAVTVLGVLSLFLALYAYHSVWAISQAYSAPTLFLHASQASGGSVTFDDFREAYEWLRTNTADDAKVLSWWDYGYHIARLANRTTVIDNNYVNTTHVARVGQIFASDEAHAYPMLLDLGVDYILVVFGGKVGYGSDDVNKFIWMLRAAASGPDGSHFKEEDYYSRLGEFQVGRHGAPALHASLLYKLCYQGFGTVFTEHGKPPGYDRVREEEIGSKQFPLDTVVEVYTSLHWLVRIYRVLPAHNRGLSRAY